MLSIFQRFVSIHDTDKMPGKHWTTFLWRITPMYDKINHQIQTLYWLCDVCACIVSGSRKKLQTFLLKIAAIFRTSPTELETSTLSNFVDDKGRINDLCESLQIIYGVSGCDVNSLDPSFSWPFEMVFTWRSQPSTVFMLNSFMGLDLNVHDSPWKYNIQHKYFYNCTWYSMW